MFKNCHFSLVTCRLMASRGAERMIISVRFLLAALCMGLTAGAVNAADVEAETPADIYNWSGFYIGAHVGYGETDVSGDETSDPSPNDLKLNGIVGGAQAGFNWQIDNFVLGAEGDVSVTDWSDSTGVGALEVSSDADLLASLRARVGFAVDTLLIYATAGAAWSDAEYSVVDPPFADSIDFDDIGLVAGGGVEWGMSDHTSVRLEGLHYNFDDKHSAVADPSTLNDSVTLDDAWVVRLGVNWRF
jgi:outer membrane immunogenic protein